MDDGQNDIHIIVLQGTWDREAMQIQSRFLEQL